MGVVAINKKKASTYDPSQEAGPSWVDPPLMLTVPPSSSVQGKIQAKPAPQVEPDEITSAGIYDDIPMVVNTAVQGTLFPEFTGYENPHRVLILGQGKDSVRVILFVRVNNNLYTYTDERLGTALTNICQGTPPPVPTRQHFTGSVTEWDRGIMGPIRLVNTMEDICNLYAQVYDEPEEKAPCVHRVQDLITYINLWKEYELETHEVMILALKEWRLPAWASQKACQKREVLRDKERA
ncbi:hypothetical protein EDD17DRAFT_1762117 [Pisolithus thermaeus]|nr:hypothetical protein EDD17DRAFT_1762117 [Pisolithus thermaeus]